MGWRDMFNSLVGSSVIKADEEVTFFPSYGRRQGEGWSVQVRGWIYEPKEDGFCRQMLLRLVSRGLGFEPHELKSETFRKRARPFLVDNERAKRVAIRLGGATFPLDLSAPNGHFTGAAFLDRGVPGDWVEFEAVSAPGDDRRFTGRALLVDEEGISIISDIDDTIKVTQTGDRRQVLANTFLRPFRAVPGMAEVYADWSRAGATFHYVSGSPWQLYAPLAEFLAVEGYPEGTCHLKDLRLKDPKSVRQLRRHEQTKLRSISTLMEAFPRRRFLLVGDAGEQDPEIYTRLAGEYPSQVMGILIRDVHGTGVAPERFAGLPGDLWRVFRDPSEMGHLLGL